MANCYLTFGKVFILQKEFESALDALNTSLAIKKELLRSRTHKEVRQIEMMISVVCDIAGLNGRH